MSTGYIYNVAGSGSTGSTNGSFSGDGGVATSATLDFPSGLAFDRENNLYIADFSNHRIRKVDNQNGIITTVAGNGYGTNGTGGYSGDGGDALLARMFWPRGVYVDFQNQNQRIYFTEIGNSRVRKLTPYH